MPYQPTEVPMEVAVVFTAVVTIMSILASASSSPAPLTELTEVATQTVPEEPQLPLRKQKSMESHPLDEQILAALLASTCPLTVRDIAKGIGAEKSDVNSRLYKMSSGKKVTQVGKQGSAPLWIRA